MFSKQMPIATLYRVVLHQWQQKSNRRIWKEYKQSKHVKNVYPNFQGTKCVRIKKHIRLNNHQKGNVRISNSCASILPFACDSILSKDQFFCLNKESCVPLAMMCAFKSFLLSLSHIQLANSFFLFNFHINKKNADNKVYPTT